MIGRDNEEFQIIRKLPKRFPTSFNDIYITNKTNFKAQLKRCESILLDSTSNNNSSNQQSGTQELVNNQQHLIKSNHLVLHAIGPAINRY